jgi:hypothetical protein
VNCRNYVSIIIVSTILYKTYTSYDTFIIIFYNVHTSISFVYTLLIHHIPEPEKEMGDTIDTNKMLFRENKKIITINLPLTSNNSTEITTMIDAALNVIFSDI